MADTQYEELEASIDIDVPPAQVWALVTDVPRMAPAVSPCRGGIPGASAIATQRLSRGSCPAGHRLWAAGG